MTKETERADFEAWGKTMANWSGERNKFGDYICENEEFSWRSWQAAIEHDRKHRGEPIAWINEDELPDSYPYDEMYPFSKVDVVRLFPVFFPETVITTGYLDGHNDALEWAARLTEANHPLTSDWLYDDHHDLAKAIRKGPEMPEATQPAEPVVKGSLMDRCYQDAEGTIPVTGMGQPVGLVDCQGRGEPVAYMVLMKNYGSYSRIGETIHYHEIPEYEQHWAVKTKESGEILLNRQKALSKQDYDSGNPAATVEIQPLYAVSQPTNPAIKESLAPFSPSSGAQNASQTPLRPTPEDEAWAELERRQCKN